MVSSELFDGTISKIHPTRGTFRSNDDVDDDSAIVVAVVDITRFRFLMVLLSTTDVVSLDGMVVMASMSFFNRQ